MRYAIADSTGKSHAYFDRRVEALDALRQIVDDEPEGIDEFFLSGYDEAGIRQVGPQSARSALEPSSSSVRCGSRCAPIWRARFR